MFTNWIKKVQLVASKFEILPNANFILLSGSNTAADAYKKFCEINNVDTPISVIGGNFHESLVKKNIANQLLNRLEEYQPKIRGKQFLCFNKIHRPHRIILTLKLLARNLIDKAYYSFQGSYPTWIDDVDHWHNLPKNYKISLNLFRSKFPMILNISERRKNPVDTLDEDLVYFNDSYFSLVTETTFFQNKTGMPSLMNDSEDCVFLTEKTARCLALKHPFILVSNPGSLAVLKEQGYKTFSPYINEEYDIEEDDFKRLELIVDEVSRLCSFSDDEWLAWQENIKDIVEHNYKIFCGNNHCITAESNLLTVIENYKN